MDRRNSIKALLIGTASSAILVDACKNINSKLPEDTASPFLGADRMIEEKAAYEKLMALPDFFTEHEMKTIMVLEDIIIPKDQISGSASDAKVHEFLAFIVKDKPELQVPLRGGLRWLDMQGLKRFERSFVDITPQQQLEIIDDIAYPAKAKPEMRQGVAFFSVMRNLVATGFYTSEMGVQDIGYAGNKPNQWNGVPDDVLKQYGLSYTEKELKECAAYD
jgi:gluconate 2-dehydrogenase gamma chain